MSHFNNLTPSQGNRLRDLIGALRCRASTNDTMKAGLTDKDGLVAFYAPKIGHSLFFSSPYGQPAVMMLDGQMVTANNVNRIASTFNTAFGSAFYGDVLENGQSANVQVSITHDVIPALEAYQRRYDRSIPLREKKAQLEQVRSLLKVWDNPLSAVIKKNIPATTAQRWRTLEKQLIADIAELEAFH